MKQRLIEDIGKSKIVRDPNIPHSKLIEQPDKKSARIYNI
jgi:hypothetical protein